MNEWNGPIWDDWYTAWKQRREGDNSGNSISPIGLWVSSRLEHFTVRAGMKKENRKDGLTWPRFEPWPNDSPRKRPGLPFLLPSPPSYSRRLDHLHSPNLLYLPFAKQRQQIVLLGLLPAPQESTFPGRKAIKNNSGVNQQPSSDMDNQQTFSQSWCWLGKCRF